VGWGKIGSLDKVETDGETGGEGESNVTGSQRKEEKRGEDWDEDSSALAIGTASDCGSRSGAEEVEGGRVEDRERKGVAWVTA
jgi:hypothetical protein